MPILRRGNIREAIKRIGGVPHVADLFGIGRNAVSNWYQRGFPPETHDTLAPLLRAEGYEFDDNKVFNQYRIKNKPKPPPKKRRRKTRLRSRLGNGGK